MSIKIETLETIGLSLSSVIIFFLILDPINAVYASIFAAPFMVMAFAFEAKRRLKNAKREEINKALRILHAMQAKVAGRTVPVPEGMAKALKGEEDGRISGMLNEVMRRVLLGQDLAQSIRANKCKGELKDALTEIARGYETHSDAQMALRDECKRLRERVVGQRADAAASIQKYSSINTVVGSIIPAFALFSLIGYMIMGASQFNMLLFSVLFGGVLPNAYAIVRTVNVGIDG